VDYSPDEPFDDSLRRVEAALTGLPDDLRSQSETLRALVPAAGELSAESDRLARALEALQGDLGNLHDLTDSYQITVSQAEATIEDTETSLDETTWLLRAMVIAAAIAGLAVGSALIVIGRTLAPVLVVDEPDLRPAPRR
jgi:ABC-type transporter Mla subunit MlaD